jgi:TPR repeat protein
MRAALIILACAAIGAVVGSRSDAPRYDDAELIELDASCVHDDQPFACEELAMALHGDDDDGTPAMQPIASSRMARALELFVAGCAKGERDDCFGASRVYGAGFGVPWNELASRTYGELACELGVNDACEHEGDRGSTADAIRFYRQACPRSPHACTKLARVEQAAGLAIADLTYRRACEHLAFDACAHVAASIDRLDGEPQLLASAFARWCDDDGDPRACRLVQR